jgi:hypothetical protein
VVEKAAFTWPTTRVVDIHAQARIHKIKWFFIGSLIGKAKMNLYN